MSEYKICMGYITHDIYNTYEDSEGHHQGQQVGTDTIDDPYYIVMEDNAEVETFDTYEKAKDYIEQIKQHDKLGYDYDDVKKMYVLQKYDGYHGEWKDVKIYTTTQTDMEELIKALEKGE